MAWKISSRLARQAGVRKSISDELLPSHRNHGMGGVQISVREKLRHLLLAPCSLAPSRMRHHAQGFKFLREFCGSSASWSEAAHARRDFPLFPRGVDLFPKHYRFLQGFSVGALRSLHGSSVRFSTSTQSVPLSRLKDNFIHGTSGNFLEEMQRQWEADPNSVDASWQIFFKNFTGTGGGQSSGGMSMAGSQSTQDGLRVLMLIRAYQVSGHMKSRLDPLNLDIRAAPAELEPASYGFSAADLDKEFVVGVETMTGILGSGNQPMTLKSIIARLENAYCDTIGFEYMHIQDRDKCNWLRERIENQPVALAPARRAEIFDRLVWGTHFESFIAQKWTAAKRFGLEGCETLIPGMKMPVWRAS